MFLLCISDIEVSGFSQVNWQFQIKEMVVLAICRAS